MFYLVRATEAEGKPYTFIHDSILTEAKLRFSETTDFRQPEAKSNLNNPNLFFDDAEIELSYMDQIQKLVHADLKAGDTVFFGDAWNPAIPVLIHYLLATRLYGKVKLCGIVHASINAPGEYIQGSVAQGLEQFILKHFDHIFVATQYLKDILCLSQSGKRKVHVTGLPLPQIENTVGDREPTIIFPHRWSEDKQPDLFLLMAEKALPLYPNIKFKILSPDQVSDRLPELPSNVEYVYCKEKSTYFSEIAKSSVVFSAATLETFGYAVIESVLAGNLPLVPDRLSYRELYKYEFKYVDEDGVHILLDRCHNLIVNRSNFSSGIEVFKSINIHASRTMFDYIEAKNENS